MTKSECLPFRILRRRHPVGRELLLQAAFRILYLSIEQISPLPTSASWVIVERAQCPLFANAYAAVCGYYNTSWIDHHAPRIPGQQPLAGSVRRSMTHLNQSWTKEFHGARISTVPALRFMALIEADYPSHGIHGEGNATKLDWGRAQRGTEIS